MEYVQGTSLREVMRKGPLPAEEALVIVRGVLSALEHAHGKGIIHRDIKPENVLVASGGIVKVADFGLSRLLDSGAATRLTHTNLLLGTFEYMAPEQREKAREADERADIYATGVVLYEMLAGELPIGHFAALSRMRPKECDSRIDEIVERSLAKSPDDRYQRASEMGAAVSRVLSAAMAPEPPPAPEAPPRKGPDLHIAARLTSEEEACVESPRRRRRKGKDDPASGVGCVVFLVLLLANRGILVAILGAAVAVAVVRGLAGARGVVRGVAGLLAAAAVVGALLLFTSVRSVPEPDWVVRPGQTSVENRDGWLYANVPLGFAEGPLPDLDRFLDRERSSWIQGARYVPFAIGASTVRIQNVGNRVVASIRAEDPKDSWDVADLKDLAAVLAHALSYAYPGSFVRDPSLPALPETLQGPPPGPSGGTLEDVERSR
jgi:serine/threonine-protein kinase